MLNKAGFRHKVVPIILTFALIIIVFQIPQVSQAATTNPSPPVSGLNGYKGNDAIYMTTAIKDEVYCDNFLANTSAQKTSGTCYYDQQPGTGAPCNRYLTRDGISLATGSNVSIDKNCTLSLKEYYSPSSSSLFVRVPVSIVGTTFTTNELGTSGVYMGKASVWRVGIIYNVSSNIQNCPNGNGFVLKPCAQYNAGYNISCLNSSQKIVKSNSTVSNTYSNYLKYVKDGAYVLSIAALAGFPCLAIPAIVIGGICTLYSLEPINPNACATGPSEYGYMDSGAKTTSQTPAYQYIPVAENSGHCWISPCGSCGKLNNTYSVSTFACIKVRCNNFKSSGDLNITGVNQMWVTGQQGVTSPTSPINGSKATISLPMVPAYMISGTVKSTTGSNLCGQKVEISDKSNGTAYVVNTNETGEYRFFAKPDCNYLVSLCSDPSYSHCLSASSTNNEGGNTSVNFITPPYRAQFTESGLPSGTEWSVNLSGGVQYSSSDSMVFDLSDGTYSYTVEPLTGYSINPSSGTIQVSGANPSTQDIKFTPVGTITFTASNVNGNTWSVTLDGNTEQASSSEIQFSSLAYGTYYYSIGVPSGYSGNPTSGSVLLESASSSVSIAFSPTSYYTVTFHESGLPSGRTWSATMTGTTKSASAGSDISFSEPDGYFSYYFSNILVPLPGDPGHYKEYYAPGGTAHVNGASQTIDVTYHYRIIFACVNASTEILLASGSYEQAQYVHAGTEIMTFNATTGSLQSEAVQTVISVNQFGMYTINGNLQVSGDQQILTNHGWMEAMHLHYGEMIFDPLNGTYLAIISIHQSHGTYRMYDFILPGNYNYVAYSYLLQGISS